MFVNATSPFKSFIIYYNIINKVCLCLFKIFKNSQYQQKLDVLIYKKEDISIFQIGIFTLRIESNSHSLVLTIDILTRNSHSV